MPLFRECRILDAHIHADQYSADRIEAYIGEWRESGIEGIVAVSSDLASSYRTLEIKRRFPDFIYAAVGHHPERLPPSGRDAAELFDLIRDEAKSGMISAIGEVGLPHYSPAAAAPPSAARHRELLNEFARLAVRYRLPLALHAVHDKAAEALRILRSHQVPKAHFHWLKAPETDVLDILGEGYFISVTPEVCYRERDRDLLRQVPAGQLLVETDGPWPHEGPFSGMETTPLLLERTLEAAAEVKHMAPEELRRITRENTLRLYGGNHE